MGREKGKGSGKDGKGGTGTGEQIKGGLGLLRRPRVRKG